MRKTASCMHAILQIHCFEYFGPFFLSIDACRQPRRRMHSCSWLLQKHSNKLTAVMSVAINDRLKARVDVKCCARASQNTLLWSGCNCEKLRFIYQNRPSCCKWSKNEMCNARNVIITKSTPLTYSREGETFQRMPTLFWQRVKALMQGCPCPIILQLLSASLLWHEGVKLRNFLIGSHSNLQRTGNKPFVWLRCFGDGRHLNAAWWKLLGTPDLKNDAEQFCCTAKHKIEYSWSSF